VTHAPVSGWRYFAPALVIAIAVIIAVAWPRTPAVVPESPIQVTLPTGDRLVGTAGARFEIGELVPASRRLRLHSGTMLFDVARVVDGQRFEVAIGDATILATGTVFSVGVEPTSSNVQVYEGQVEVHHGGRVESLAAGESWSSGMATADPAPILEAAQQAVIARATRTPTIATAPAASTPVTGAPTSSPAPTTPIAVPIPAPRPTSPTMPAKAATVPGVPTPAAPAKPDDALALAQSDLGAGRYQAALDRAAGHGDGAWLLVSADAHRGLGHAALAADTYDRAAKVLTASDRAIAGYNAAYLRFRELRDPAGALASLEGAGVAADDSPIEERGIGLAVQALLALHRDDDARPFAERYLKRFPRGDLVVLMRKTAKP
jgi:hypothetical protein